MSVFNVNIDVDGEGLDNVEEACTHDKEAQNSSVNNDDLSNIRFAFNNDMYHDGLGTDFRGCSYLFA